MLHKQKVRNKMAMLVRRHLNSTVQTLAESSSFGVINSPNPSLPKSSPPRVLHDQRFRNDQLLGDAPAVTAEA